MTYEERLKVQESLQKALTDRQYHGFQSLNEYCNTMGIPRCADRNGAPVPWGCWPDEFGEIVYSDGYFDRGIDYFDLSKPQQNENGQWIIDLKEFLGV